MNAIVSQRSGLRYSSESYLVDTSAQFVTQPRFLGETATANAKTEAVEQCLARNSGALTAPDYRGVIATIVYRWMPESQLCLITKIDQAETLAPVRTLGKSIAIGSGFALFAAGLAAYWLALTLTKPIEALEAGAQAVGSGNLHYRIPAGGHDELGRLAEAFNLMAADLQQSVEHAAYSQRVVLTLSGAGQAVQRSHTAREAFFAVSREVSRLHYLPMFFVMNSDCTNLTVSYLGIDPDLIQDAEELIGFALTDLEIPIRPESLWQSVISGGDAIYFGHFEALLAEAFSEEDPPTGRSAGPHSGDRTGGSCPP